MRVFQVIIVIACSFWIGCAIVITPSGGAKDIIPPKVLESTPENYAPNFVGKEIVIEFDEFIKLNDLYNNFIVSPPIKDKPEVVIRGKSIVIKLKEELPPNTTVNFNFGNSIVDLHEGNAITDYHFVVSTGAYVDSLSIYGKAILAESLKPAKDVWVMMYACQDYKDCDSLPSKIQPQYLTKTNKYGGFSIRNIKKGAYKVFGLIDQNRNSLFDLPNESIAFIGELVEPGDSTEIQLKLFDQEDGNQKITKIIGAQPGLTKIGFKLPVGDIKISALDFSSKTRWEFVDVNTGRDTIYYWNTSGKDSLRLQIIDKRYTFDEEIRIGTGNGKPSKELKVSVDVGKTRPLHLGKSLEIRSTKPLTTFDKDKIKLYLQIDSNTYSPVQYQLNISAKKSKLLQLEHDWKPGAVYKLRLETKALTDLFAGKSDSLNVEFSVRKKEYYGTAIVEMIFPDIDYTYIVQLLDARGKVSREDYVVPQDSEQSLIRKMSYKNVVPGKYKLKVIYDVNNNRRWDTGNHPSNSQPERIAFAKEQILIRANWDLVLDWTLD